MILRANCENILFLDMLNLFLDTKGFDVVSHEIHDPTTL